MNCFQGKDHKPSISHCYNILQPNLGSFLELYWQILTHGCFYTCMDHAVHAVRTLSLLPQPEVSIPRKAHVLEIKN